MSQESNKVAETFNSQTEVPSESRDFESVTNKILDLRQDNGAWQQNISDINDKVDMKKLGFPDDFKILDVQQDGKLLTVSEDGSKIQVRDAHGLNIEEQRTSAPYNPKEGDFISKNGIEGKSTDSIPFTSAFKAETQQENGAEPKKDGEPAAESEKPAAEPAAEPKKEVWGSKGREFTVNPDGSSEYVAKGGDNYWSVAADVAAKRLGRPIDVKNADDIGSVNGVVNELATLNNKQIVDGKIALEPNETIKIPAGKADAANPDANKTEWGSHGRKFDVKEDGSAEYSAKGGDNYWFVARDVVEKRLGHKVDATNSGDMTKVNEMTAELAKFNGKAIINGKVDLAVGEPIKIPPHESQKPTPETPKQPDETTKVVPAQEQPKPEGEGQQEVPKTEAQLPQETPRERSDLSPGERARLKPEVMPPEKLGEQQGDLQRASAETQVGNPLAARDGIYKPAQAPGFEGSPGETWRQPRREGNHTVNFRELNRQPETSSNGHKTHTYIGAIEGGAVDTRFKAGEERGANGELLARQVNYERGVPMRFEVQPGQTLDLNVQEIKTQVDGSGNYRSQITTADGNVHMAITSPNGQSRTNPNPRPVQPRSR